MASSPVDICNQALALIGQKETIDSLDDDGAAAEVASTFYDDTLDEVLSAAPWPFARAHAQLAQLSTTRSGWAYMYSTPALFVSARYIFNGARPGQSQFGYPVVGTPSIPFSLYREVVLGSPLVTIPFSVEASDSGDSQVILTDQSPAELIYTKRITAVVAFPPLFRKGLTQNLAAKFASSLPVKASVADYWDKKWMATKLEALAEAFRSEREDPDADARWVAVRG